MFASYALTVFLQEQYAYAWLSQEDGVIESAGAILFLLASIAFVVVYIRTSHSNTATSNSSLSRIFSLSFAVLFFVAAGEEISWGQRLFGWETPEMWKEINRQEEINLHNMAYLHGNTERIFNVFCLLYGVVVPVVVSLSRNVQQWFEKRILIVPPLWISGLIILNLSLSFVLFRASFFEPWTRHAVGELRETLIAFIFLTFGLQQSYNLKTIEMNNNENRGRKT